MDFYKSPPFPDDPESYVDYEALLPHDKMMPKDFRFLQEPLFHQMLESKKNGTLSDVQLNHIWLPMRITDIQSPSDFHFALEKDWHAKIEVDQMISEFFEPKVNEQPPGLEFIIPPEMVKEGMSVVACRDLRFFRACVERIVDKHTCVVRNVDIGNRAAVYKKNLHFIPKWLAEYPVFGYRGKLTGVKPMGGKNAVWNTEATHVFRHIVLYEKTDLCTGAVHYFTKDGKAALYIQNSRANWADKEMIFRRVAQEDTTPFAELPDRVSRHDNEEAALIEDFFIKLPKPYLMRKYGNS